MGSLITHWGYWNFFDTKSATPRLPLHSTPLHSSSNYTLIIPFSTKLLNVQCRNPFFYLLKVIQCHISISEISLPLTVILTVTFDVISPNWNFPIGVSTHPPNWREKKIIKIFYCRFGILSFCNLFIFTNKSCQKILIVLAYENELTILRSSAYVRLCWVGV